MVDNPHLPITQSESLLNSHRQELAYEQVSVPTKCRPKHVPEACGWATGTSRHEGQGEGDEG